ncbi:MAG: transcriptional repressor LexA [Anaerolineae bacterium]|nr:transcriptional repressor LexA [Anaerolineae bacterium]
MALSKRQQRILEYIHEFTRHNGYPPTIRQIGDAVGISSTSVVNYNLNILEQAGYITRDRTISRGIKLVSSEQNPTLWDTLVVVPLLGRIVAGEPIPVPDGYTHEEVIEIPRSWLPRSSYTKVYALRVRGDSMIDALINDNDIVLMQYQQTAENGDMIAAWLINEQATTLKRFYHEGDRIRLQPENRQMQPIYVHPSNLLIQGKVVGVIRWLD